MKNNATKISFFLVSLCLGCSLPFINQKVEAETELTKSNKVVVNIDNPRNYQELVQSMFDGKTISKTAPLYNFDDSEDFVCMEFNEGGYATFYKESMELLEYSPAGNKISEDSKMYYGGPDSYLVKTGNAFKNIKSKKLVNFSTNLIEKGKELRQSFRGHKIKKNFTWGFNSSNQTGGDPSYDDYAQIRMDSTVGTRLPNSQFFVTNPLHGENYHGSCGAIATEMVLCYNNFYNDRRIIPNKYLNGDSGANKELNPNYCTDPMSMTTYTCGARGINEFGNDDPNSYFRKILDVIPFYASHSEVRDGIKSILNERNNELSNKISYNVESKIGGFLTIGKVDTSRVKSGIDQGFPSIILLRHELGADMDHWIVAHGYNTYKYPGSNTTYDGLITHFGYGPDEVNVWVNSSWVRSYNLLTINHEHNYSRQKTLIENNRYEYKCTICGQRTDAAVSETLSERRFFQAKFSLPENHGGTDDVGYMRYYTRIYKYKDFYFKPSTAGKRMIQTFSDLCTRITVFDKNYSQITQQTTGWFGNNATIFLNAEAGKVYIIRVDLHSYTTSGGIRLVIMPNNDEQVLLKGSGTNISATVNYSGGVGLYYFEPMAEGTYEIKTDNTDDTYLHVLEPDKTTAPLYDDDGGGNRQAKLQKEMTYRKKHLIVLSRYNLSNNGPIYLLIRKVS